MAVVHFEDKDYDFDIEAMDLAQARAIKSQTGLSIRKLMDGLGDFDPEAMAALYWLMLKQNGVTVDIRKVNFKVLEFAEALGEAFGDGQDEEDPTSAADAASLPTT